jgi:hypothetical protein
LSQLKPFLNNKPIFRMEYRTFARSDTNVQPVPTRFSTCKNAIPNHVIVPTRNKSIKHNQKRNNLPVWFLTSGLYCGNLRVNKDLFIVSFDRKIYIALIPCENPTILPPMENLDTENGHAHNFCTRMLHTLYITI